MQFNNYYFILFFLPIFVVAYFGASRIRPIIGKLVIIVASLFFYGYGRIDMLLIFAISIVINYLLALLVATKREVCKWMIVFPLVVNVGLLIYFKYLGFAVSIVGSALGRDFNVANNLLPLGISFYTFQQIAYVVSVGRGDIQRTNLVDYLCYILFFPKLVMGPLMEPQEFIIQINDDSRKKVDANMLASGIKLFSLGLIKKVLLADTFSRASLWVFDNMDVATSMDCVLLVLFYSFEIYFDFSGYSDMAIGIASMINIDMPINFDSPYKALSIRDFWKRWHISLTKFLTKYIYIPLGGSRKGTVITYVNTMIVFIISGGWHGAGLKYIMWGFLHGIFSCFDRLFEKYEKKLFEPVRWFLTFSVVGVLWLLFSASSMSEWIQILLKIVYVQDTSISSGIIEAFNVPERWFIIKNLHLQNWMYNSPYVSMIIFVIAAYVICLVPNNNYREKNRLNIANMFLTALCLVWGILCLGTESTFVYYGF